MESVTYVTLPLEQWQRVATALDRPEELLSPGYEDEFITMQNACDILGVSKNTFREYRKKFNIPVSQVGRNILVRKSEINKIIEQRHL